jgi:hypothetical protein
MADTQQEQPLFCQRRVRGHDHTRHWRRTCMIIFLASLPRSCCLSTRVDRQLCPHRHPYPFPETRIYLQRFPLLRLCPSQAFTNRTRQALPRQAFQLPTVRNTATQLRPADSRFSAQPGGSLREGAASASRLPWSQGFSLLAAHGAGLLHQAHHLLLRHVLLGHLRPVEQKPGEHTTAAGTRETVEGDHKGVIS